MAIDSAEAINARSVPDKTCWTPYCHALEPDHSLARPTGLALARRLNCRVSDLRAENHRLDTAVDVRTSTDVTAGIARAQCMRSPELTTRRLQIDEQLKQDPRRHPARALSTVITPAIDTSTDGNQGHLAES